jgi:hypothetical protein
LTYTSTGAQGIVVFTYVSTGITLTMGSGFSIGAGFTIGF